MQPVSFPHAGVKITLVDTPGFNNTTKSDIQVMLEICNWMSGSYRKGKLLSGIIYLHRITDVRMDGPSQKTLMMFGRLCGPNALQNVLLTTTHWSNVDPARGMEREDNLRDGNFWGGFISRGASLERFMGTRESGLELIYKLMHKEPKPLRIQHQMVDEGRRISQTDAGEFMNAGQTSLQKKHQGELEDLRRELREALNQKDDLLREILAEQRDKAQENWKMR